MNFKNILFTGLLLFCANVLLQAQTILEYWANNDYSSKSSISVPTGSLQNLSLSTGNHPTGFNQLNFRIKDGQGRYSPISRYYYVKLNDQNVTGSSYVIQYWFDGDAHSKKVFTLSSPNEIISMDALSAELKNGMHRITYRVGLSNGVFSLPMTDWFEKGKHPDLPAEDKQYITDYKYWTDNDTKTGTTVTTHPAKRLNLNGKFFIPEEIPTGKHLFNMQFKDNFGQWSLVAKDSFNKKEITTRVFIEPKLIKAKPLVGVESIQTFKGADFTPGGLVNLFIKDSKGNIIPTDPALFEFTEDGRFTYKMAITSSMPDGIYEVSAMDVSTGTSSPKIIFRIKNPSNVFTIPLSITAPSDIRSYATNSTIMIGWSDFISSTRLIEKSGLVPKFYRVEYSIDGGANWTIIKDSSYRKAVSHKVTRFSTEFSPSIAGNYIVKVSDVDNVLNFNTASFKVETFKIIKPSLVWDYSTPNRSKELLGVAADGTARIYIKLNSNVSNTRKILNVQAALTPGKSGDNSLGPALLGKIMYSTDINKYSLEANEANSVTANQTFTTPSSDDVNFWYVAPDDFTHQRNNQEAERTVKATFTIHYDDNTSEVKDIDIIVVRPPLMLVHGLNGSDQTFQNAHYNVDGSDKRFMNDERSGNSLFKNTRVAVNLKNYESYSANAEILLGIRTTGISGQENFKYFIKQMNEAGFAANRVDYVCHSMGGDIARTVLSEEYKVYYRPSETSEHFFYKNYDSGFINKLITINTPHNGSPVADVVAFIFNPLTSPIGIGHFINNLGGEGFIQPNPDKNTNKITPYIASNAILDLRQVIGGVRFNKTIVKNHLIGSSIEQNILNTSEARDFGNDEKFKLYNNLFALTLMGTAGVPGAVASGAYYIISNSDGVVPLSSQYPGLILSSIPNINDITEYKASIAYGGLSKFHSSITDDISVGTKVMQLLNSEINSTNFADEIAANPEAAGNFMRRKDNEPTSLDSIKRYMDTNFVKIISPSMEVPLLMDSTVNFRIQVKDTNHLNQIQVLFQGEFYQSTSKVVNQTFNFKVHSNSLGYNSILVIAVYDSSGFRVDHMDTATYLVKSIDTLIGFYVTPKSQILNSEHIFYPKYYAVYENYNGKLNEDIQNHTFSIADTNVVHIDSLGQFITKDTGSTYIVFTYKGFSDTAFVYITLPSEYPDMTFSGKVFLQGAYNASTSKMNNTLNSSGILKSYALSQPYNSGSARYSGYENISASYFDSHPDIVDWVLIELRDSSSPQTIIARRAAFVRHDGTLVEANMSGLNEIVFKNVAPAKYYVSIRHRNHLGIRSSSVVDFTESDGSYDFTTSANQSFQNKSYTSTIQVGNVWVMRAGDANGNGNIKYNGPANDQSQILNSKLNGSLSNILNNLYSPEDINMDGKIRWNGPGNEQNYLLNTILLGSLTTIYVEQL